jgi:ethanolamine ammonia-lyase small subunit
MSAHEPTEGANSAAPTTVADAWADLRQHTPARLALGRAGSALPTAELLRFGLAHAMARDAVHQALDLAALQRGLAEDGVASVAVHSAAAHRAAYLLRPDQGRRLRPEDAQRLRALGWAPPRLLVVVADGLSALAVARQARPFLAALRALAQAEGEDLGPVVLAQQARVALGDEVGECLGAQQVLVLIGERPGLSSPDSLGLYLTWQPRVGRHDAERNCISNVRQEGLPFEAAAQRCWWLVNEARRLRLTGVGLKDRSGEARLPGPAAAD